MMTTTEKLAGLREKMNETGVDAYVITTDDFHASEYVGAYFREREYMSGFTGSAGTLVVLPDTAALFTDGRYFIQAEAQLAGSTIELMKSGQPGVPKIEEYLYDHLDQGMLVGFDGRTVSLDFADRMLGKLGDKKVTLMVTWIWSMNSGRTDRSCHMSRYLNYHFHTQVKPVRISLRVSERQ